MFVKLHSIQEKQKDYRIIDLMLCVLSPLGDYEITKLYVLV